MKGRSPTPAALKEKCTSLGGKGQCVVNPGGVMYSSVSANSSSSGAVLCGLRPTQALRFSAVALSGRDRPMNRRQLVIGMGALSGTVIAMRASVALAVASQKADFIKAAMAELDESARRQVDELMKKGIAPAFARAPHIIPFVDLDYFYTDGSIKWVPNEPNQGIPVTVPEGFVSDLASIPQAFWSILPKTARHAYAAVVHDYLYWTQTIERHEADLIFKIAMQDLQVPIATVETLYNAVYYGGQSAWDDDAKLKAAGEKRILKRFPESGLVSWSEWRTEPDVFSD